MRLAEAASSAGSGDSGSGQGGGTQEESGVVDAEFEEVDKRDRKAG